MLKQYMYFMNREDYSDFINIRDIPIYESFLGIYGEPAFGNEYESDNSSPTLEIINYIFNKHYDKTIKSKKSKKFQRKYLYKIDSICEKKNIDLILVATPYHSEYKKQIASKYYNFFIQL